MCKELEDELKKGVDACEALIDHCISMSANGMTSPRIIRAEEDGSIIEWEVSVRQLTSPTPSVAEPSVE